MALRERWTDVVVGSSCAAQGLSILDALLAFPNRIPLVSTFDPHHEIFIENQIPTLDRVISDLLDQTEFDRYDINRDVCGEAVRISKTELVTALSSAPRTTERALPLQPRSIISLSPRSNGIRVCNLRIPRDIGMHSIFEEDKDGPLWNSSLCLTGSLADVHLNCRGTTQLVVNVQCNQLWLFWPATARNLAWWNTRSHPIKSVQWMPSGKCTDWKCCTQEGHRPSSSRLIIFTLSSPSTPVSTQTSCSGVSSGWNHFRGGSSG